MFRSILSSAVILGLVPLVFASQSSAQSHDRAATKAIEQHHRLVKQFQRGELGEQTQMALETLRQEASAMLRQEGFADDAEKVERNFDGISQQLFEIQLSDELGILDVGDFAPLNSWFSDTYKRLKSRFSGRLASIQILQDLNTLNYTIPVVFRPKGNKQRQESWDQAEYRLHFVPFSRVVSYWVTYAVCFYFLKEMPTVKYCKRGSRWLSWGVENYLAPKVSDWVYVQAMGNRLPDLEIQADQLLSRYEAEIPNPFNDLSEE